MDKGAKQVLRGLRTVNKPFYNICTRLIYKTAELRLRSSEPYIPGSIQRLSKSERRQFVQHIDLVSLSSSIWPNTAAKMQAIREIPTVLARFPALKSLHVDLGFMFPHPPRPSGLGPVVELDNEEVELPAQPLGGAFQLYPNGIQALCLHRSFFMSGCSYDHTRDLARIMPSLRFFKFDGGLFPWHSWEAQAWEGQVLETLRYAKRLEVLSIQSVTQVLRNCIKYLPRDIPLRHLEISQVVLPPSDLVSIARFAHSLEVLEIHAVEVTDGTWEEVFNSLCALRRLTVFRGKMFVYKANVFPDHEADSARQVAALNRFMKQVLVNRDRLGINATYQGSSLLAARRGGRCTLGETPLCW